MSVCVCVRLCELSASVWVWLSVDITACVIRVVCRGGSPRRRYARATQGSLDIVCRLPGCRVGDS